MSAVIGLTEEEGAESFLAALETGLTSEEQKKDKSTMPGMGENPSTKSSLSPRRERKRRWQSA